MSEAGFRQFRLQTNRQSFRPPLSVRGVLPDRKWCARIGAYWQWWLRYSPDAPNIPLRQGLPARHHGRDRSQCNRRSEIAIVNQLANGFKIRACTGSKNAAPTKSEICSSALLLMSRAPNSPCSASTYEVIAALRRVWVHLGDRRFHHSNLVKRVKIASKAKAAQKKFGRPVNFGDNFSSSGCFVQQPHAVGSATALSVSASADAPLAVSAAISSPALPLPLLQRRYSTQLPHLRRKFLRHPA